MLGIMRHRGPDQSGIYESGSIALGLTRLSIIDNEKHIIPYESPEGSAAIVYNGEIYNHIELRRHYKDAYAFKTTSDAETILCHYLNKGVPSFGDYNGMYAFAIHDAKNKETYIVRDKSGEKPLYYAQTNDFFAFASEIKALLKFIPPVFNKDCISYEAYEFNAGDETVFKGIYNLMPGEYIKINRFGKANKHVYWKIWDYLIDIPDNLTKIESRLTDLIVDAIELRTRNCVHRYGTFVSGGVDSALVACIAKPDYIYTCHYPMARDCDELEYAKLVARKIKKRLVIVRPTAEDFQAAREKIIYHLDTPCTWTSFGLWMLFRRAHKDIKVILSGEGADEIFSGYHRYHLLNHDEQIRNLKAMEKYTYLVNRYYGSAVERYAKIVNRSDNRYNIKVIKYLEETLGYYFSKMPNDHINAMGVADFYTTLQVILQFGDRMSMAFSVENRAPFLDDRLIQFAFSIPSKYKIRNGVTKWILKKVAGKFIPKEIVARVDKRGFYTPFNQWFDWSNNGKYDRASYKHLVFGDWSRVFKVQGLRCLR